MLVLHIRPANGDLAFLSSVHAQRNSKVRQLTNPDNKALTTAPSATSLQGVSAYIRGMRSSSDSICFLHSFAI